MEILYLTNNPNTLPLAEWLKKQGEKVDICSDHRIARRGYKLVISYNYASIIEPEFLRRHEQKCINLHIAYLPWNRGAYPAFWAVHDNTPLGVTIHWMGDTLDSGAIITQKQVEYSPIETIQQIYDRLQTEIQELFRREWETTIKAAIGTYHSRLDFERKRDDILIHGWNTMAKVVRERSLLSPDVCLRNEGREP